MLEFEGVSMDEFVEYKGRPIVRQGDDIFYGDMSEKYYVYMMIMSYKKSGNSVVENVPDKIMVQLVPTDGSLPVKQRTANGLLDAYETACAWLPALGE